MLGAPDILVNNAGAHRRVKLVKMRESEWDYVLDINLRAGCFAAIAFYKKALIASSKSSGSVISVSSQAIRGVVRGVHLQREQGWHGLDDSRSRLSSSRHAPSASTPSGRLRPTRPSFATATPAAELHRQACQTEGACSPTLWSGLAACR